MDVIAQISRLIGPVQRRLRTLLVRGKIEATNDSAPIQTVNLGALGEQRAGLPRMAEYGFASRPPVGAEAIVAAIGGDWGRGVVIATDDRAKRPTELKEGECCLWTPEHGRRVHCGQDGHVDLGTQPQDFVALANLVLKQLNEIKADLDEIKATFDGHTHGYTAYPSTPALTSKPTASVAGAPLTEITLSWSPDAVSAEEVRAK